MAEVRLSDIIASAFHPVHTDIRKGGHAEYWLKGGRGSTKSSFISLEIVLGIMRNPETNAIIYRKVATTLRDSVFEQMQWAITMLGAQNAFSSTRSPLQITYKPTGQRIMFRGADNPEKSKSLKVKKGYFGYLWFEELTEFASMRDIAVIKASVIRGVHKPTIFYSYNPPESQRNWTNTECMARVAGRMVHHSDYTQIPAEWLGEGFIDTAATMRDNNDAMYRHMYLGEVTGTGNSVFDNIESRTITNGEIATFGECYMGLDFGWYPDPAHWLHCSYNPSQRVLHIFDEYRTFKTPNFDLYERLVTGKKVQPHDEIIADSAEQKSIGDFRAYGLNCVGAVKGPGSVAMGIKWLQGLRRIVIDPDRCPYTANEFLTYEHEIARTGEIMGAYPDKNNHSIDAARYATNRIWLTSGA